MMSYQSMEERKFVCKYCSKRFPCGKSLGGHIRTHMMSEHSHNNHHSALNNEERNNAANGVFKFDAGRKRKRDLGSESTDGGVGNNNMSYGLRENPKKTTRFVHSNATLQQLDKFCKECGKGFPSLKALCGHMACHSEKDKGGNNNRFESSSGFGEKQKLVMDSQSDTETSAPRRSKRMKFKTISNNNQAQSSSVSEVEQEQEEVARCLMLLSKDSSYKGRFALVTESNSDNNSVVLEAKSSPSLDTKVTTMMMMNSNNGKNSMMSNAYVEKKLKLKQKELFKSGEVGYDSDNSDSGYFRYGPKKVDSDDSNDGFFRNEVKSSKVGYLSGFEEYDVESRKVLSRGRNRNSEFTKFVLEDWENDRGEDVAARKFDSKKCKKSNYGSLGQNLVGGVSSRKIGNGFTNDVINKYECLTSERDNGSDDSAYESDENSTDTDSYPAPKAHTRGLSGQKGKKKLKTKKNKSHECPICNKIFRSGQALGGHKRSHFVGGSEENTLVIRASAPPVPCLIDLNLPAPVDE